MIAVEGGGASFLQREREQEKEVEEGAYALLAQSERTKERRRVKEDLKRVKGLHLSICAYLVQYLVQNFLSAPASLKDAPSRRACAKSTLISSCPLFVNLTV